MAESVTSTAFGPVVIAAMESLRPAPQRILADPRAVQMLPVAMQLIVKSTRFRVLRQWFTRLLDQSTPGIYGGMIARKRYIEDQWRAAVGEGVTQLVILGAGLDTLGYRLPSAAAVQVYEVDLPENIRYKAKKLTALYGRVPAHVTLVPIDFETESLTTVLASRGYRVAQRSFFVWEGVTQYLTEAALHDTWRYLADAAPGSRLVFTYILQAFITGEDTYGLASLYKRFRGLPPVWLSGMDPEMVPDVIGAYGWICREDMGTQEYRARYFAPLGRSDAIAAIERAVYAEKGGG